MTGMPTPFRPILTLILLVSGNIAINTALAVDAQAAAEQSPGEPVTVQADAGTEAPAHAAVIAAIEDPAARGRAIFEALDQQDSGYGDLQVELRMVLRTSRGKETERALRIRQLEVPEDADKVMVVFDAPANIRGTALLSHGHIEGDDDQWLYLPALARTKKIASRNKSGPFVGSEFSFEDLSPRDVSKYTYEYIREEELDGQAAYVVDRFPEDQYSGYKRQRIWLDKAHLRTLRIDYYNRQDKLTKRLRASGYQLYEGRYHKPAFMQMQNLKSGKSTDLHWQDYTFRVGLSADRDFSVASLRRAR